MPLPTITTPTYELEIPSIKKKIKYRPFLVKEQKNLMMALESDEPVSIQQNVSDILNNCTLTEGINIDKLPIIDVEYYFINLRAKSVGEIVETKYRCENYIEEKEGPCWNLMDVSYNILY